MANQPNAALRAMWEHDRARGVDPLGGIRPTQVPALDRGLREDLERHPAKRAPRPLRTPNLDRVRTWAEGAA